MWLQMNLTSIKDVINDILLHKVYLFVDNNQINRWKLLTRSIKASAHSFKQFTSRLLKLTFSLSMHIYNSYGRHA